MLSPSPRRKETFGPVSTIKTTVYLNAADYRRLKSMASEQGRSAAELVRDAVAQYAAQAAERRWPRSIGIGDSGIPDLADRYEEYMDGFGEDGLEEDADAETPQCDRDLASQ